MREVNKLTAVAVARKSKPGRYGDGNGLWLQLSPTGTKSWLFRYMRHGKARQMGLGPVHTVSLAEAREKATECRKVLLVGDDPIEARRARPMAVRVKAARGITFKKCAEKYISAHETGWHNEKHRAQWKNTLKTYVYPHHGSTPIKEITTTAFHSTLKRLTAKGLLETAGRVRAVSSRVFRYAIATGRAEADPAAALIDALPRAETTHFAAITDPVGIGKLLRAIDGYDGQPATRAALRLAPYVFVRPSELRLAEWSEIDLDAGEWRIPDERTKMSREHFVPLARQAVQILRELAPHTGHRRFVFPGIRDPKGRPLSENTLNAALRRLDYTNDQMVAHGFRSMASTRLNELGFDPNLIEVQLAHMDKDRVRAIYNRAEYIEKRRVMMQSWADYLDGLRRGASVSASGPSR